MPRCNAPPRPGPARRRRASAARWGPRTAALALLAALVFGLGAIAAATRRSEVTSVPAARGAPRPGELVVRAAGRTLVEISTRRYAENGRVDSGRLRSLLAREFPDTASVSRRRARITYRYSLTATLARAVAAGPGGGMVSAVRTPVAAVVRAPVVKQALRNNCESAALEVLLATLGRRIDQRRLQQAFPRSGPRDPTGEAPQRIWGDPDRGYVGRPEGGGVAGGFGIYPGPVRDTARRFDVELDDLTGRPASALYDTLRSGRAVMAWIGLSAGPYGEWETPRGRRVKVNFGEHTVVVHGLRRDGRLLVSNPLHGTREIWTQRKFETLWTRLGRRALAT
jgi:uncharacterized protein YvpB